MAAADYNYADGNIYVFESFDSGEQGSFSVFNPEANTWTNINKWPSNTSLYGSTIVDERQQIMIVLVGTQQDSNPSGVFMLDISPGAANTIHHIAAGSIDSSCTPVTNLAAPSLTYDMVNQEPVAWPESGNTIYMLHVNKAAWTMTCTSETYGSVQGTSYPEPFNYTDGDSTPSFHKWNYDYTNNIFILANNISTTAWYLKRSPSVTVTNTTASTLTNTNVTIAEAFAQGDIANYPQAKVTGSTVTTQADVKQRWSDGSVRYTIVNFVLSSLAASASQKVFFVNQATGNNTGYLTQAQMLGAGYNFDMQIQETGTNNHTISANTILTGCGSVATTTDPSSPTNPCRYWLQGPIATAVILDDRSAARSYDFSVDGATGNPLHPYYECWFYPQNNDVDCIASVENDWSSSTTTKSMRDQTYAVTLTGNTTPTTLWTHASFKHYGNMRWMKDYCINGPNKGQANGCQSILVDHNMAYEAFARAIPNYDPAIVIPTAQVTAEYTGDWGSANQDIVTNANGNGCYQLAMNAGGTSPWFGLFSTCEMYYWFSHGAANMTTSVFGNAQVAGSIPFHYREADSTVSATTLYYDKASSVSAIGRTVSVNARPKENYMVANGYGSNFNSTCSGDNNLTISLGSITDGPGSGNTYSWGYGQGDGGMDSSHWPELDYTAWLISGKFTYAEEAQMAGAYQTSLDKGCSQVETGNPGPWRYGTLGVLWGEQPGRGSAWMTRAALWAWAASPDSSPEQAYFSDKLQNSAVYRAGFYEAGNPDSTRTAAYNDGVNDNDNVAGNPVHVSIDPDDQSFVEGPLDTTAGHLFSAWSPWEEQYMISVFGQLRDMKVASWDTVLSFMSKRLIHVALDSSYGGIYMVGSYRIPTKLCTNGATCTTWKWVQNGTDFTQAFTQGNGAGLATNWTDSAHTQETCNYSPDDDHYHSGPLAALSFFYPYSDGTYTGRTAYDTVRVSLYKTTGCMPAMFNNTAVDSLASPKWEYVAA